MLPLVCADTDGRCRAWTRDGAERLRGLRRVRGVLWLRGLRRLPGTPARLPGRRGRRLQRPLKDTQLGTRRAPAAHEHGPKPRPPPRHAPAVPLLSPEPSVCLWRWRRLSPGVHSAAPAYAPAPAPSATAFSPATSATSAAATVWSVWVSGGVSWGQVESCSAGVQV